VTADAPAPATVRVLVVDDSPLVRERVVAMLSQAHGIGPVAAVGEARIAATALAWFRPDVVVLDLAMPDRGGLEVLRDMQQLEGAPRVVVLTNHAEDHYRRACMGAGAYAFLDKSKDFERLLAVIADAARARSGR
jgi:DNA-binding NarL/FixJ family response regulator